MKKFLIIVVIIFIFFSCCFLYSRFIATRGLKIKEYKVVNNKIINEYHGLKIIHLSDIHYNSIISSKQLENITNQINELKPDIVVITGDLIDERIEYDKNEIINQLSKIEAKLGKYAISGNHDVPLEDYNYVIEKSGFKNINNTYELIYDGSNQPIIISGMSSNIADPKDISIKTEQFDNYISNLKNDDIKPIYSILLMHEPDFVDNLDLNNYDLILAGHSHKGQINLPIIKKLALPYGALKYYDEHYKINNTDLYISSGLGTSKLKLRLFNRPSFNFYRITNK